MEASQSVRICCPRLRLLVRENRRLRLLGRRRNHRPTHLESEQNESKEGRNESCREEGATLKLELANFDILVYTICRDTSFLWCFARAARPAA